MVRLDGCVQDVPRRPSRPFPDGGYVLATEWGGPFTTDRHGCGYALANKGHDTRNPGLARASQHSAHGAVHRVVADALQGFLVLNKSVPLNSMSYWSQSSEACNHRPRQIVTDLLIGRDILRARLRLISVYAQAKRETPDDSSGRYPRGGQYRHLA